MAKKSVGSEAAYKSKGMKQPGGKKDMKVTSEMASMAPTHKPKSTSRGQKDFMKPDAGQQSMAPSNKGNMVPAAEAPAGVAMCNSGSSMALPKSGGVGESDV